MKRTSIVVAPVLLLAASALGCKKSSETSSELPAGLPAGYPVPAGEGRTLEDSPPIAGRKSFVFNYPNASVSEVADKLRSGLRAGGWPLTYDRVEGSRHFLSTEKDGTIIDATVFASPDTTLTVAVSEKKPAAERSDKPVAGTPPAKAPPAKAPPRPGGYPADFPLPDSGTRDPGYPPSPGKFPAFLFVLKEQAPAEAAKAMFTKAEAAGWSCTDYGSANARVCLKGKRQMRVRGVAHPQGGTALFIAGMPDMP